MKRQDSIELTIFFTVVLDLVGHGVVVPLVPFFIAEMNANAVAAGLLVASFPIMQLLASPVLGRLSDRVGRRPVLLLSLFGNVCGLVFFTIGVHRNQLAFLFVGRMIGGVTAANLVTCQAVMADISSPEDRPRAMGRIGAAVGLGYVIGPVLGGLLSKYGYSLPTSIACILVLIDLLMVFLLVPETKAAAVQKSSNAVSRPAQSKGVLFAVLFLFLASFVILSTTQLAFPLSAHDLLRWSSRRVAIVFATIGLIAMIVQGLVVGPVSKRYGLRRVLLAGTFLASIGMSILWLGSASGVATVLGLWLYVLGHSLFYPLLSSFLLAAAGSSRQGFFLGLAQSVSAFARAIGPASAGFLYYVGGAKLTFSIASGLAGVSFATALLLLPRLEGQVQRH